MNFIIKKQYRYACTCGCGDVAHSFSKRKAEREANGEIMEVWSITPINGGVIADCYTEETAIIFVDALTKLSTH